MLECVAAIEMMCKDSGKWEAEVIFQLTHSKNGSEIRPLCAKQYQHFILTFVLGFLWKVLVRWLHQSYRKISHLNVKSKHINDKSTKLENYKKIKYYFSESKWFKMWFIYLSRWTCFKIKLSGLSYSLLGCGRCHPRVISSDNLWGASRSEEPAVLAPAYDVVKSDFHTPSYSTTTTRRLKTGHTV